MKDVSCVNRAIIVMMPLFGCIASAVSGYFLVYLSMIEDEFKTYHNFSQKDHDFYFTIMVTALPVGAFLGTYCVI